MTSSQSRAARVRALDRMARAQHAAGKRTNSGSNASHRAAAESVTPCDAFLCPIRAEISSRVRLLFWVCVALHSVKGSTASSLATLTPFSSVAPQQHGRNPDSTDKLKAEGALACQDNIDIIQLVGTAPMRSI